MLEPRMIFGYRLKQIRKEHRLSQARVGEMIGLKSPSASINHYEKSKHQPDIETATKIAELFDVPLAYFYTVDDELAVIIRCYGKPNVKV
jgi:transcriptional regulator with XRE-family HTH domain